MNFRVAALVLILGRGRGRDKGRVDDGSFAHDQTFGRQVPVDGAKNLAGQFMLFKQAAERQQRSGIGRRLAIEIDADKSRDSWLS